jgi:hypothetical protein
VDERTSETGVGPLPPPSHGPLPDGLRSQVRRLFLTCSSPGRRPRLSPLSARGDRVEAVRRPGNPNWVGGASQIRVGIDRPQCGQAVGWTTRVREEEEDGDRVGIDRRSGLPTSGFFLQSDDRFC